MALPAEESRNVFCHGQLHLTGQNLGRVFNFRFGHLQAEHFRCYQVKLPNLKLNTRPKQLLGSLLLVSSLYDFVHILPCYRGSH
jgi:hypothetical protein